MGISAALLEQTVRDPNLACYPNASLADFHVPINANIPEMEVEFIDEHDPYNNAMGVKDVGKISIVGVAATVSNALFHCHRPPPARLAHNAQQSAGRLAAAGLGLGVGHGLSRCIYHLYTCL